MLSKASYLTRKPASIVNSAENEKKNKYWSSTSSREGTLHLLLSLVKVCLEKKLMLNKNVFDETR